MEVVLQQLGVVVGHFFEVGNEPALVYGVAVEATRELVVDATAGHFFERGFDHGKKMLFFCLLIAIEEQINSGGMREFWCAAKAAIFDVKKLRDGLDLGVYHAEVELRAGA